VNKSCIKRMFFRHLDNILVSTTDGCLFHVDFGFIFGDDPKKPFTPEIKICPEMISGKKK
jgi:phosphatidylinositol 3-kinase